MNDTTLIICDDCGAMRAESVPECFCGCTAYEPAPAPKRAVTAELITPSPERAA